jgi:hypothetical protein
MRALRHKVEPRRVGGGCCGCGKITTSLTTQKP